MWSHVKPLSAHLLCYVRFRQTEDVTGTVKTQLLCCHSPPPKKNQPAEETSRSGREDFGVLELSLTTSR